MQVRVKTKLSRAEGSMFGDKDRFHASGSGNPHHL